ncbi:hypothetical protein SK128_026650 [Halocaridina rubra]|uniref:Gamma-interferon-inducible lysosomal thiol reductase n=1 Tax=Halocaridina rubra TaxID=373956 RepID=A0AAN9FUR5_HALRR
MRLAVGVGVIVGGAVLVSAQDTVSYIKARSGKQLGFNNRQQQQQQSFTNNLQQQLQGYSTINNNKLNQQDYNSADYNALLQQYVALASSGDQSGYYNTYSNALDVDYLQDPYVPAASFASGVAAENPDSSPALSALALLGFLYFLNLIQDVLQGNGRKRRSLDFLDVVNETFYSTSYLDDPHITLEKDVEQRIIDEGTKHLEESEVRERLEKEEQMEDEAQEEPSQDEEEKDFTSPEKEELFDWAEGTELKDDFQGHLESDYGEPGSSPRAFSYLENFFIKLPQALGLTRRKRPQIERDGREEKPMTVGSYITSRLKMISSILSFLKNPSPLRIRRDSQVEDLAPILDLILETLSEMFFGSGDDSQKDKNSLKDGETSGVLNRIRRFTQSMNVWYDDLGGKNYEPSTTSSKMAAKVTSMLGGGSNLQEAMKKDAVPAFLELTKGLDGHHPHCLQRALCRMNSHTHSVSFIPRLAIQFLSNQLATSSASDGLAKANTRAMAAGREGLDCEKEFPDCVGDSWCSAKENAILLRHIVCPQTVKMDMGGGRLIRFMILVLIVVLVWKLWDYSSLPGVSDFPSFPASQPDLKQNPPEAALTDMQNQEPLRVLPPPNKPEEIEVEMYPPLRVAVYYEALCPDSRHFIMKQLTPAFQKLKDIMDVSLVPYGKAHTFESGVKITFSCQHGPPECQANMVHACVTNIVRDMTKQLSIVHCMIDKNFQPMVVGQKCVEKYEENWQSVEECVNNDKGVGIMKHMGDMTQSLNPPVTFIPTITINGSQEDQKNILKDLHRVLCKRYKGPKPKSC